MGRSPLRGLTVGRLATQGVALGFTRCDPSARASGHGFWFKLLYSRQRQRPRNSSFRTKRAASREGQPSMSTSSQDTPMQTILVVEDDRPTRHLLPGLLKAAKFTVVTAQDGANALRQLKKRPFDLMLLDIWMPRMSGLDLLARLRDEPHRPKVVVMTSDDTPETLLQAVREHAYQYIKKPVEPKALVELLRRVLTAAPSSPPIEV